MPGSVAIGTPYTSEFICINKYYMKMYCCSDTLHFIYLTDPVDTLHFPPSHVTVNTEVRRYVFDGAYIGFGNK